MSKITEFRVIEFKGAPKLFDYPHQLPIPQKDDRVLLNGYAGIVDQVTHNLHGNVFELKIKCS